MAIAKIKGKEKPKFTYRERTAEDMQTRQKSFSGRDSYFSNEVKFYIPKAGSNKMRIMPPTWDDAKHYGQDIYVHYGIGPDNVGYLCLDRMNGEKCPLCEARIDADNDGDEELAKSLRATRRVAVYVIDRNAELEGPKVWAMPQTVDKEISAQAWDKETGEVYALDNPDEGYDISFDIEGQGPTKKYTGIKLARRASPLSDNDKKAEEWLEYVVGHPVPDMLTIHDYDTLKEAFEGKGTSPKKQDEEEESKEKSSKLQKPTEKPTTRPKIGGSKKTAKTEEAEEDGEEEEQQSDKDDDKDDLPTWAEVHELDADGIEELSAKYELEFGDKEFADLEECQDFVCELLEIEEPKVQTKEKPSFRDRLKKLQGSKK